MREGVDDLVDGLGVRERVRSERRESDVDVVVDDPRERSEERANGLARAAVDPDGQGRRAADAVVLGPVEERARPDEGARLGRLERDGRLGDVALEREDDGMSGRVDGDEDLAERQDREAEAITELQL